MTLKSKLVGIIGVAALGMTIFSANAALASTTASAPVAVNVVCEAANVGLTAGNFADYNPVTQSTTSTAPGAIDLTVDTGCNFDPWQVNVTASPFYNSSNIPVFFANTMSLTGAAVTSSFFDGSSFLEPQAPDANNATFNFLGTGSNPILETSVVWFFGFIDQPAPFTTTAEYTGNLSFSNIQRAALTVLGDDTYTTTLQVDLVLNP
jgi:hypothetical protein